MEKNSLVNFFSRPRNFSSIICYTNFTFILLNKLKKYNITKNETATNKKRILFDCIYVAKNHKRDDKKKMQSKIQVENDRQNFATEQLATKVISIGTIN